MGEIEDLLHRIRNDVAEVKADGHESIRAEALDAYLAEVQNSASLTKEERDRLHQGQLEHFKAQHASNLAHYAATIQVEVAMLKAVIGYGVETLKAAMLVNGGAAVAVLGFLSAAATKTPPPSAMLAYLPLALVYFATGALVAGMAVGVTYISQALFAAKWNRAGARVRWIAVAFVVGSYLAFALGAARAYMAFR